VLNLNNVHSIQEPLIIKIVISSDFQWKIISRRSILKTKRRFSIQNPLGILLELTSFSYIKLMLSSFKNYKITLSNPLYDAPILDVWRTISHRLVGHHMGFLTVDIIHQLNHSFLYPHHQ
jgi:hypothetical protein